MAGSRTQPSFRRFAPLQSEPAKGSLDPHRKSASAREGGAARKREILSFSQYQDPRDQLDQERHALLARARQERDGTGDRPPEAQEQ